MYIPPLYKVEDPAAIAAFLRQNNFAAIISHDGDQLLATHAAMEVTEQPSGRLVIYGHIARANPQWKTFGEQELLLIFEGPHTYISPRWYNHANVPTWNYMMAHVYGRARILQGEQLSQLFTRLVQQHETGTGYTLDSLPQDLLQKQMAATVGFVIDVTRVQAGWKLSQNRNDEDHANIIEQLRKRDDAASDAIAAEMAKHRQPKR